MRWRRHRRTEPALSPYALRSAWQVTSLLLDYPTAQLRAQVPALRAALADVPDAVAGGLTAYLDRLADGDLRELQADYVDTFDVTRRCALHLTYYTCGDTRKRGVELVRFKQAYRDAGVEFDHEELPDHLGVVLEFGALVAQESAWRLLCDHRVGIELLYRALGQRDSSWLPVIASLRETLPVLDGDDEVALARLIAAGPPSEEVGLEPYAIDPLLLDAGAGHPNPPLGAALLPLTNTSSAIPVTASARGAQS